MAARDGEVRAAAGPGRRRKGPREGSALKLAFVIQRYGLEVNGGAELHCRWLAERLAQRHQVEVFATRALDYLEWRNHYPKGTAIVNGIPVHRSSVKRTRNARVFASLSNICFHEAHTREEEEAWVRENGPYSPELVKAVTAARDALRPHLLLLLPLLPQLPRRPGRRRPRDPGADRRGGPGDRARDHEAAVPGAARHRLPHARGAGARRGRERQQLAAERRDRQRHQPARGRPGARLPPEARPRAPVPALRRPHRPQQGRAHALRLLQEVPGGDARRRGPGAGGEAGRARSPTTRASATSASSASKRRWRRSGNAGCW